jgi:collagen type I alpha
LSSNDITIANPNGGTVTVTGITTDSAGDVFLIGNLNGTASFGGQKIHSTANTSGSGFVAKLSSGGTGDWAQVLGGPTGNSAYNDTASGLAVSSSGSSVYVGVNYIGTLDLPGGGTLVTPQADDQSTVLQLNGSTGTTNYDIQLGSNPIGNSPVNQIVLDNSGNLYVTGGFYDLKDLTASTTSEASVFTGGGATGTITVPGSPHYFGQGLYVLKATASSGALSWVTPVNTAGGDLDGSAIAVNNSGTVFMVGALGSNQFGAASNSPTLATTGGNLGGFVAAINSSGTFQWEQAIQSGSVTVGGKTEYSADSLTGVAVDESGNPIVTGTFGDGAILNPGNSTQQTLPAHLSQSGSSLSSATRAFVEKFNSSGTSQWVSVEGGAAGSTLSTDNGGHIIVDGAGNIVASGVISGNTGGNAVFGSTTIASPGSVANAYMWTMNDQTGSTEFAGSFTSSAAGGYPVDGALAINNTTGSDFYIALNTGGLIDINPTSATNNVSASANGGLIEVSLTDQGQAGCFAAGTRIATPYGEVAVEDLREGDLVLSHLSGQAVPVQWIGHRFVDCSKHPRTDLVWPVRVRAGAFGASTPHSDVFLSPDHAVFVDGVLVPVHLLINTRSIEQVPAASVTYYHIALPEHGVVLAHGLPAESYLDIGDRREFDNGGGVTALFANFSSETTPRAWEVRGCARLVVTGPELSAIRAGLSAEVARAA